MAKPPSRKSNHRRIGFSDARSAALSVLNRLDKDDTTLDAVLDDADDAISALSRVDRGLFNQLVYGSLRWRLRLDTVVEAYANRPLKKVSPIVRNILRLALYQILFMDRIPPSAAVNTAVNLARAQHAGHAAGFVNALLRNVLREPERFKLPDAKVAFEAHLALAASMPQWLVARWIQRLGAAEAERLCQAVNIIPPISLRCNDLKNRLPELVEALVPYAESVAIMEQVPGGVNLVRPRQAISRIPAFIDGRFAVQDGAAQLVSLLLAPRPGEMVLDACAGLGGKTTHLAQLMRNRGQIVALDQAPSKLARLTSDARRLGASIIDTRQADLNQPLEALSLPRFDRILVDAPCTGLGVLRRNPDAKWSSHKQAISRLAARQARFLDHLAPLVKPGGKLVFAVCSMEPEENEQVVVQFLKKHVNFAIADPQSIEADALRPFLDEDGYFRTAPHIHHMDGFFAVRLQRAH